MNIEPLIKKVKKDDIPYQHLSIILWILTGVIALVFIGIIAVVWYNIKS